MNQSENPKMGKGYQSEVKVAEYNGQTAFVKSIPHPNIPGLSNFERWMLEREALALKRLDDIDGIPDFLGYPDDVSIAMELVEGKTVREAEDARMDKDFFVKLMDLVKRIHSEGIVHSDLKKKENILITTENFPCLVDFGTSLRTDSRLSFVSNFFYDQCKQMDLNAVSKLKSNICPESMTDKDKKRLNNPILFERLDRFRRDYIWDW